MSGSPIIQDSKLVGAVTPVFFMLIWYSVNII